MKKYNWLTLTIAIIGITMIAFSCKKKFDEPPYPTDPSSSVIKSNLSIKSLKAMHTSGKYEKITTDIIISGTVIANDKSGNLYKEIYIQDDSAAIAFELESSSLHPQFPVGRKIYIKCNGLWLSDYGGMIQLGAIDNSVAGNPAITGIPFSQFENYIVKGAFDHLVNVTPVTSISSLGTGIQDPMLGTLIQLDGYEFAKSDTARVYADTSANKKSVNYTIKDCSGANSIIVRTSGYANFAGVKLPGGNGKIVGLYTVFGTTKQLIIRDLDDVQLTSPRCNLFEEDFGSLVTADNKNDFTFVGWKNIPETGNVKFKNTVFGTTGKALVINAFGSGSPVVTTWLVSPPVVLPVGTTPHFSFTTAYRFAIGPTTLKAYISTDYNGSNTPWTSTWTPFTTANIPANSATNNSSTFSSFVSAGSFPLTATGQPVYFAFKYEGGDPTMTTVIELDDIKVSKN